MADRSVPIIGLNHRHSFMSSSRLFQARRCPDPAREPEHFVSFLVDLGKKVKKAVLFPCDDISVFLISSNKKVLEEYYQYPYLEKDALFWGFDKWQMYLKARDLGIPVPRTLSLKDIADIDSWEGKLRFPVIIKPIARFNMEGGKISKIHEFMHVYEYVKALVCHDQEELICRAKDVLSRGLEVIIQEEIPGLCETLFECKFYSDKSGSMRLFSSKKIRQFPADFGICTFGEKIDCPEIESYTKSYVSAIGYKGIGETEFKYDARDGAYKFLELNPRSNHWMSLAAFRGMNFVAMQYQEYSGLSIGEYKANKLKTKWFYIKGELEYLAAYSLDKKSIYHLPFFTQIRSLATREAVEAVLSWEDPFLSLTYAVISVSMFIRRYIRKLICKITNIDISRHGITVKNNRKSEGAGKCRS